MNKIKQKLIAPCGMNCALCYAHLREENRCEGCRVNSEKIFKYCAICKIKNCEKLQKNDWQYCSSKCDEYPCRRLKNLDKRYCAKYGMSMIENLENIERSGIRKFVETEKKRWMKEDKVYCVHHKKYY